MKKLGFYTEWFGAPGVVDAIRNIRPPTLLSHVTDNDALRRIRKEWSPATFIIGRPFIFPPSEQDHILDSDSPARQGRELADRILRDFPIATERIEGRLVVDAWMALNESVRGPNSFPEGYDHNAPDYREMVRRAAAYDELEEAFQNRLVEQGLQAVAFNFGAGNWVRGEDYLAFFPRVLRSHKYLGFHEYGWPHMNPDQPDASSACGTYRQVMQVLCAHTANDYEVIITEAGLARMYMHGQVHPLDDRPEKDADVGWLYPWDSVSEERYRDSLRWYNRHLLEDDYVKGACLFQVGPGGKWVSFRHTGEDNQGRPLALMDELFRMSQEPALEPARELAVAARSAVKAFAPQAPSLVETLRATGQALIVPFNRDAMLRRVALQNNLGERLTGEYEEVYDGKPYVAQIYERGLVYAPAGNLEQAQVTLTPRTRNMAAPPEGRVKSGIHFSNKFWERPSPEDFELLRRARPTCIKTCLFADDPNFSQAELHGQLKAEHPQALIVARLFAGMGDSPWPAQEFVTRFKARIDALQGIVTWFEVHNEPNIDPAQAGYNEGFGATDKDFQVFRTWARDVLNGLRANHPWAKWVFPGNAIHRYYEFWQALMDTIPLFDAWGVHCYWQQDRHVDPVFGRCYERAHALLPNMPIIITECGDSTLGRSPADKIPIYLDWLRHVSQQPYILGTAFYILGGTQDWINQPGIANFDVIPEMADAIGCLNEPPRRGLPAPPMRPSWPLLVDGFDFPVGKPDARDYYVVAGLVEPAYYEQHRLWNTGEDWVRRSGPDASATTGLGDPVYAVAHGRVVTARAFADWGQVVLVEHLLPWGQTVWSQYACLQERYVRRGDVVRRGDQIGTMGKGNDGYPARLHFEIRLRRLPASRWGWKLAGDRDKVLRAYAYPTQFINSHRPR